MYEEWKDIPGYEGYYQVSQLGRVRTVDRYTKVYGVNRHGTYHNETWHRPSRMLKPIQGATGLYVHLYKEGQPRASIMIKRLVAQAFLEDYSENITTSSIRLVDETKGLCVDNLYIKH